MKIKSCPFCGHPIEECDEATYTGVSFEETNIYSIQCWWEQCLINPGTEEYNTPEKAIKAWNTRYNEK